MHGVFATKLDLTKPGSFLLGEIRLFEPHQDAEELQQRVRELEAQLKNPQEGLAQKAPSYAALERTDFEESKEALEQQWIRFIVNNCLDFQVWELWDWERKPKGKRANNDLRWLAGCSRSFCFANARQPSRTKNTTKQLCGTECDKILLSFLSQLLHSCFVGMTQAKAEQERLQLTQKLEAQPIGLLRLLVAFFGYPG